MTRKGSLYDSVSSLSNLRFLSKEFLKTLGKQYDYEGAQRIRNREEHKWERVIVFSFADYFFGTQFVCYKAE